MEGGGSFASVADGGGREANGLLLPAHAATATPIRATATILDSIEFPSPDSANLARVYSTAP
jgi:hypothetical protein